MPRIPRGMLVHPALRLSSLCVSLSQTATLLRRRHRTLKRSLEVVMTTVATAALSLIVRKKPLKPVFVYERACGAVFVVAAAVVVLTVTRLEQEAAARLKSMNHDDDSTVDIIMGIVGFVVFMLVSMLLPLLGVDRTVIIVSGMLGVVGTVLGYTFFSPKLQPGEKQSCVQPLWRWCCGIAVVVVVVVAVPRPLPTSSALRMSPLHRYTPLIFLIGAGIGTFCVCVFVY